MTIYADIASAVLGVLPDFSIGGSTWTRTRVSGDMVTGAPTTSTATVTAYIVRNAVDTYAPTFPGTPFADAAFIIFAATGTAIQGGDALVSQSDSSVKFNIKGALSTDMGMMVGECELGR